MNNRYSYNNRLIVWLFILTIFLLNSCGQWTAPPELVGQWTSNKHQITVRTEPEKGKFEFISDSAVITLMIHSDNTVTGLVGAAVLKNGIIRKNWGNPEKTGIAYSIDGDLVGKIFEIDPFDNKEVGIWLGPQNENIDAELRYTESGSHFPMAGMIFTKDSN